MSALYCIHVFLVQIFEMQREHSKFVHRQTKIKHKNIGSHCPYLVRQVNRSASNAPGVFGVCVL